MAYLLLIEPNGELLSDGLTQAGLTRAWRAVQKNQTVAADEIGVNGLLGEMHDGLHVFQQLQGYKELDFISCPWNRREDTYILFNTLVVDQTLPETVKLLIRQHPVVRGCHALSIRISDLQRVVFMKGYHSEMRTSLITHVQDVLTTLGQGVNMEYTFF